MKLTKHTKPGEGSAKNWDLKLAAILFIGTCATMSLVLPNWHEHLAQIQVDNGSVVQIQTENSAAVPAQAVAAAAPIAIPHPNPAQQQAALESYQKGQEALHKGDYNAAVADFKKSLEKSPELAEAYVGLGDAFSRLGDYTAAENNARHALSKLKLLKVGQAPDISLKKKLAYAHQVLGITLLHLAKQAMEKNQGTIGRMQALEAASHCNLATVFDQSDSAARRCIKQADSLTTHT